MNSWIINSLTSFRKSEKPYKFPFYFIKEGKTRNVFINNKTNKKDISKFILGKFWFPELNSNKTIE